jgi:aerobic carbon-monoxide dehydrogenase large subunit
MVTAGGAVAAAGRIRRIAGHLLQADPQSIVLADGVARSASGETSIEDVAAVWYLRQTISSSLDEISSQVQSAMVLRMFASSVWHGSPS